MASEIGLPPQPNPYDFDGDDSSMTNTHRYLSALASWERVCKMVLDSRQSPSASEPVVKEEMPVTHVDSSNGSEVRATGGKD